MRPRGARTGLGFDSRRDARCQADRMNPLPAGDETEVKSPCTSICRMDPATRLCEGCLRTIEEIAAWSTCSNDDKRAVLARISRQKRAT